MTKKKKTKVPVKKQAPKNKGGRPSKYKPEYAKQVEKLCILGATVPEVAEFFEVNPDTINEWRKAYPAFRRALDYGRMQADAEIADRLFQRAKGFEHDSEEIKVIPSGTKGIPASIERVPIRKIYPPDTAAAIFWLKNRQSNKWREKIDLGGGTGTIKVVIE